MNLPVLGMMGLCSISSSIPKVARKRRMIRRIKDVTGLVMYKCEKEFSIRILRAAYTVGSSKISNPSVR
jgi:hypothetical protein